jgi:hypothetical protein
MAKTNSVGATQEMMFNLPSSLLPSQGIETRVQPATGSGAYTTAGSVVRFVVGEQACSFLQNDTAYLSGTISVTGGTPLDANACILLGSAYSWIARQVLYSNNTLIETIENPSLIYNALVSNAVNTADKQAMSCSNLFNPIGLNTNCGPVTNAAAGTNAFPAISTFQFCIPIIGVFGSSNKYLPLFNGEYVLELTLNSLANFSREIAGGANYPTGFSVSNLELNFNAVKLEQNSFNMLMGQYNGKLQIKADSWTYTAPPSIAAATAAGQLDLTYPHKLQSLKRIIWWTSPADAAEKSYAGVNPNLSSFQLYIGNTAYPQMPVKSNSPAETYVQTQKAFGSLYSSSHSGSAPINSWATASTAYPAGASTHIAYNATYTLAAMVAAGVYGDKWFAGLDLETINANKSSLFTGINSQGVNSFLRLNIQTALANAVHNVHIFSNYDCLIEFDLVNKVTNVVM